MSEPETNGARTFQFQVADPALLRGLRVGSPVYANFDTQQVSLDGKKPCCKILNISTAAFPASNEGFAPPVLPSEPPSGPSSSGSRWIRPVPHRHLVFALPKVLRPAFRHRRRLLPKLALCAWKALSSFLREDTGGDALPAAIVSLQTAGEFLNWHPHLHVLAPAGSFREDGSFAHSPVFAAAVLRDLFQANVLALLLKERMISPELVERMREWRHSGFYAYAGEEISDIEDALRVGLYMVRGPAATSRLCVDPSQEPKVRYLAKGTVPDHGEEWTSSGHRDDDYLEWIARLTSHIPDRGTHLVRYYGACSNAHRGVARKREIFLAVPPEDEPPDPPRPDSAWLAARRKSWARLIRRVYEVDPLLNSFDARSISIVPRLP